MARQISNPPIHQNMGLGASLARSLSQPTVFANNSLPPLSPSPHSGPPMPSAIYSLKDAIIEDADGASQGRENVLRGSDGLPPRKGHRRSNSDVLFGISASFQYPPQLMMPMHGQGDCQGRDAPILLQKQEVNVGSGDKSHAKGMGEKKFEGGVIHNLFSSYMNLGNLEPFYSSGNEDKSKDSMVSGTKQISSGDNSNETESGAKIHTAGAGEKVKRSAAGDTVPVTRHFRSLSMDSAFPNLSSVDESQKLPTSLGNQLGQLSPSNSLNERLPKLNFDLISVEFSEAELKKIMADERLAEVATTDPKQVKRILANRHSAARSKERKMRYISELEHKVYTLQTEATTSSAQITTLQKDISRLKSENNELQFRLQAMGHQAQLRDGLHESLSAEIQCLKLAMGELREEGKLSNQVPREISQKHHMFQVQRQQPGQVQVSYCQ
ncbi:PREDICTED: transcription factor RF2a-like [Ipomoea nil]|uniref:transcription factor RF2a-like n=1 Tax=Ipomoea nil TaxID=35883 RepID=UPI000901670F|nr:PREDICTED: transcription factor RF2a-like [Ipomoea nil]